MSCMGKMYTDWDSMNWKRLTLKPRKHFTGHRDRQNRDDNKHSPLFTLENSYESMRSFNVHSSYSCSIPLQQFPFSVLLVKREQNMFFWILWPGTVSGRFNEEQGIPWIVTLPQGDYTTQTKADSLNIRMYPLNSPHQMRTFTKYSKLCVFIFAVIFLHNQT